MIPTKTFDIHQRGGGTWHVTDESHGCGGVFVTLDAALKFVREAEASSNNRSSDGGHHTMTRLVVR